MGVSTWQRSRPSGRKMIQGRIVYRVARGGPLDGFRLATLEDDREIIVRLDDGKYVYEVHENELRYVGVLYEDGGEAEDR